MKALETAFFVYVSNRRNCSQFFFIEDIILPVLLAINFMVYALVGREGLVPGWSHPYRINNFIFYAINQPANPIRPILHCKKRLAIFPSPAGMSLTKLSLGGKN